MSDQWNATILTPAEIEALSSKPATRMAEIAGVSNSSLYNALKGKKVSGVVADRLRAAANGKASHSTPAQPKPHVNFGNGRPGEDQLTLKERRELRSVLGRESLKGMSQRIGVSEAALARARDGKPIRGNTGRIVRGVLAGDSTESEPSYAELIPPKRTGRPPKPKTYPSPARPAYEAEPQAPSSRDVASFVQGQIIMAEFLSMSILNFLNGNGDA